MSHINICNIVVKNNPSTFLSPFCFSITFECLQPIKEEIEWKVTYVGSPKDDAYDQELDSFSIGPFTEAGIMQFDIEPMQPDISKIPQDDLLGVAAIIHSVSYQKQEFFRVGYFVYNNYEDPFLLENPYPIQYDKIVRSILADKPRIIRHQIDWESESGEKIKALNNILMENSNIINGDNTIQFRGMFSDLNMGEQPKTEDQKLFNNDMNVFGGWNNNNNNNNNAFGFNGEKENFMNNNGGNNNPFAESFNNNQYNNAGFMGGAPSGGFNLFGQQQNNDQGFGMMDNRFMNGNNMMQQGGMNSLFNN